MTIGALLLAAIACPVDRAGADDVAAYLERRGLSQLLALHFEEELAVRTGAERTQLAIELANLYATLLEEVTDTAVRADIERRSRALLADVPAESADGLRLALLRGTYRGAARHAEDHRLRLASEEDLAEARAALDEVIPALGQLQQQIDANIDRIERRLSRASGVEASIIADEAQRYADLLSQSAFIGAWARYYRGWLTGTRADIQEADDAFVALLDTGEDHPDPRDVSVDLREMEAYARAILGVGMCQSALGRPDFAMDWIELLEHPQAYEEIRRQAPAWRMAVALENQRFDHARIILEARLDADEVIPLPWVRLAAAWALEAGPRVAPAAKLAEFAVAELAGRGELSQVLDLARRYGTESLGSSGFAVHYVRGVQAHQRAREIHDGAEPTFDPDAGTHYQDAVEAFRAALYESDAAAFPEAAASCRALVGWCLYYQGQFRDASRAFDEASLTQSPAEAAKSLWMAIVCLDKVAAAGDGESIRLELDALIDRFLSRFPASEHAPELIYRRVAGRTEASPESVDMLLSIPPNSRVHAASRHRAAHLLYQLFRRTSGDERIDHGHRCLAVAIPLINADEVRLDDTDDETIARFFVRVRQALEVALDPRIDRPVQALDLLQRVEALGREGLVDVTALRPELDYRWMQQALLAGDHEDAARREARLREDAADTPWARTAARTLFKHAVDEWRTIDELGVDDGADRAPLERVTRYGKLILEEYADEPDAIDDPGVMLFFSTVAEASMRIWERTQDPTRGEAALFLYRKLLERRPQEAAYLRAVAVLTEAFDEPDVALECWRRLVAGSGVGTERWYDSKHRLIALLATTDAARAREVLDQHKRLNPDYGPEPWRALFLELDASLPGGGPVVPPDPQGDEQDDEPAAGQGETP